MKRLAATIAALVVPTLCIAQQQGEAQAKSHACQAKYRMELPAGATPPKSDGIRIRPAQFEPKTAYACVLVRIDENGQLRETKVMETDYLPFAKHLVEQVNGAKWQPASLDGVAFAFEAVVSASYDDSR